MLALLSEVYGRSHVLQLANIFFLIFNFVNRFADSEGEFLAFRFLSGLGACTLLTIGAGVLSDLWRAEEIGMAVGLYTSAFACPCPQTLAWSLDCREILLEVVLLFHHHFRSDCANPRFLYAERDLRPPNLAKESPEAA